MRTWNEIRGWLDYSNNTPIKAKKNKYRRQDIKSKVEGGTLIDVK